MLEELIRFLIFTSIAYLFKITIDKNLNKEIEKLKNDLEKELYEFKIKYSFFYQKRAEAIAELYKKIYKMKDSAVELIKPMKFNGLESLGERKKQTIEIFNSLHDFYYENKIYFDENTYKKVEEFLGLIKNCVTEFNIATSGMDSNHRNPDDMVLWEKAWTQLVESLPPLTEELERSLKNIIDCSYK